MYNASYVSWLQWDLISSKSVYLIAHLLLETHTLETHTRVLPDVTKPREY